MTGFTYYSGVSIVDFEQLNVGWEANSKILDHKINESQYITLFVVSVSIKKLFSIYYVNISLFSIFSQ